MMGDLDPGRYGFNLSDRMRKFAHLVNSFSEAKVHDICVPLETTLTIVSYSVYCTDKLDDVPVMYDAN